MIPYLMLKLETKTNILTLIVNENFHKVSKFSLNKLYAEKLMIFFRKTRKSVERYLV